MALRIVRVLAPLLLAACVEGGATPPPGGVDVEALKAATPAQAAVTLGAAPISVDARGVPRLLRATNVPAAPRATSTESARALVQYLAPAWGVHGKAAELAGTGEIAVPGGTIVRLAQSLAGMPVWGGELRVLVRPGGELVTASGVLRGTDEPRGAATFAFDDASALTRAVAHTHGRAASVSRSRVQRVWYPLGEALVAAYVVEAYSDGGAGGERNAAYRTVLAAGTGKILAHDSLVAHEAFDYRVWADTTDTTGHPLRPLDGPIADFSPHPTGVPDGSYPAYVAPSLVRVDGLNHPGGGATPDPWLPAAATETAGNNVDAYVDLGEPGGLSPGDFRAPTSGARAFDYTYDLLAEPLATTTQQRAAIVQLFYTLNWLHDFWYDAGFTEAAGNAQASNYGRGGAEGDVLLAEAQDNALGGSRNNANMATPEDGMSPRMQVFLWSGMDERALTLMPGNRQPETGSAGFGPGDFDITGTVVAATPADACMPLGNVSGRIVLVNRGDCQFEAKALAVQTAGGIGMILVDNVTASAPPGMSNGDNTVPITIGSLSLTLADGNALRGQLAAGPVTATLFRESAAEADGSLDNTTVAHEFGHYLHHRLTLCGNAICRAMSEGWGDFLALMLLAEPGDPFTTGAFPFSVYATQGTSADAGYYGIRRAPYSYDQAINSLSLRHIAEGAELPTTHPFRGTANNSEVHNAGEIWTSALWDLFVAFHQASGDFEATRTKVAQYIVAGLLLTPTEATITEARDAILQAINAASPADHAIAAAAFARRGLGSCALPPPRNSSDFVGVVESFEVKGRVLPGAGTFADDVESCDEDGILDANEVARITVQVTNPGPSDVTDVTIELVSDLEGVTVRSQPVTVASFPAYTSMPFTAEVALGDVTGAIAGNLGLQVRAVSACSPVLDTPVAARFNVDDSPNTATTDTFDAVSIWTPAPAGSWTQRRASALDGNWQISGPAVASDAVLTSPALKIGDGDFRMQFEHKHSYEQNEGMNYDGAVLELTTDDGQTWIDVMGFAASPYGGLIASSDNPLANRMAFVGRNPSYPARDEVTLDFGDKLKGRTIKFRFRQGSDVGTGSEGWEIDYVELFGVEGKPFPSQVPDNGDCEGGPAQPPGDDDGGGCCQTNSAAGPLSTLLATLGLVLGLRRRKRT